MNQSPMSNQSALTPESAFEQIGRWIVLRVFHIPALVGQLLLRHTFGMRYVDFGGVVLANLLVWLGLYLTGLPFLLWVWVAGGHFVVGVIHLVQIELNFQRNTDPHSRYSGSPFGIWNRVWTLIPTAPNLSEFNVKRIFEPFAVAALGVLAFSWSGVLAAEICALAAVLALVGQVEYQSALSRELDLRDASILAEAYSMRGQAQLNPGEMRGAQIISLCAPAIPDEEVPEPEELPEEDEVDTPHVDSAETAFTAAPERDYRIRTRCYKCSSRIVAPREMAGMIRPCPKCGTDVYLEN